MYPRNVNGIVLGYSIKWNGEVEASEYLVSGLRLILLGPENLLISKIELAKSEYITRLSDFVR